MVYLFSSTSKISYAGGGIAAIASSDANLDDFKNALKYKIISYDKMNMLRHVRYFKNVEGVRKQMKKHAEIMRVNFNLVDGILKEELEGLGIGTWNNPKGGYFISFDAMPGCAREIIAKAKEAGLVLTEAGATFPYHKDPEDKNIRIAPSLPPTDELKKAAKLFTICVKLVSINKILNDRNN
jgi:DNA-binding transcriptional MocR family regulator